MSRFRLPITDYRLPHASGFTIIELIITIFIIGTVITGIFGLFVLSLRSGQEGERRVVAIALGNERAEMVRNLPYADVGTHGGIPSGSIAQEEVIVRNGVPYNVRTDIRYIDDPFDGLISSQPPDPINTDYKQVRLEVSWNSPSNPKPLLLVFIVAPPGIEGGESAGTLDFQALDAAGQGIAGATLVLSNTATNPAVNITTNTDSQGRVLLPGLPESSDSYELHISKAGYTTEQTYDQTTTFIPDVNHAHLSMIQAQITPKTFVIDVTSNLALTTQNEDLTPQGVAYTLRGTKSIGVDDQGEAVFIIDGAYQTDAAGQAAHEDIIWDSYDFAIDGETTGYDIKETSVVLPIKINPGDTIDVTATLMPHTPISLHVTVVTPAAEPVDNATVTITHGAVEPLTLGTGMIGQVFFSGLVEAGDYAVNIDAPGFENFSGTVPVAGSTRTQVQLTPVGQ